MLLILLRLKDWCAALNPLARLAFCLLMLAPFRAAAGDENTNVWKVDFGYWHGDSSPAIAPDGTSYTGSFIGKLFAVTSNGVVKWTYPTPSDIHSSPAIAAN